jgi:hypothetical protein
VSQNISLPASWLEWGDSPAYSNSDVYGPLVGAYALQEAYYSTLQTWLPSYIAEFNRQLGSEILKVPHTYRTKPDLTKLPQTVEAQILVVCHGTKGAPKRHNSTTRSIWNVTVAVFVPGTKDWQESQALTHAYGAAARVAIAQHPALNGIAETTLWCGEQYQEQEHVSLRTLGMFTLDFETTIANTMNVYGGPSAPSILAPGALGTVETAIVTIENEERELNS